MRIARLLHAERGQAVFRNGVDPMLEGAQEVTRNLSREYVWYMRFADDLLV